MTNKPFHILPVSLLNAYRASISAEGLQEAFDQLEDAEISTNEFSFYIAVASVYSSKIEGERIDLGAYVKHKRFELPFEPDYTQKTDDLYQAYQYARQRPLSANTAAELHTILGRHIVSANWLGKYRPSHMFVTTKDGRIEYVAAQPGEVPGEMGKLFTDLERLLDEQLTIAEAFFFASMLHLVFVKIHPWVDGNGRSARLLEKWFLSQHLGPNAWFLESEHLYYLRHDTYYQNIRKLGLEYPELDYQHALPFLLMLPECLKRPL